MRCLFIHLKFRHWSLDGSNFIAQDPQFSWTTHFLNGYCTVCVVTRRGVISYSVFVGSWNSSWNSSSLWLKCDDCAACGKWCWEFSGCRTSVTDEQRSQRPSTSADLVTAIEESVHANWRVLLKELEEQFNLSHGTIWDIVQERLGYRKVCSRRVPRHLT